MFSWPYEEKIIFLKFSGSGMQIENEQNTVPTVYPSLFDILSAMRGVG